MARETRGSTTDRCGVDLVEVARFERLLEHCDDEQLQTLFTTSELEYCRSKKNSTVSLAGRLAVKEACLKLFPREAALREIDFSDFEIVIDPYGAPQVRVTKRISRLLNREGLAAISVSLTHTATLACGMAIAR